MSKMRIVGITLTSTENPFQWTDASLDKLVNKQTIVGYILKPIKIGLDLHSSLNLYVIDAKDVTDLNKVITLQVLKNVFMQWIESLAEDPTSYLFRNPPLDKWLETKENWIKKVTHKLSESYNQAYDECLSSLYMTILHCYSKENVYMGNLHYLVIAANNKLKIEHRYMRNRLTGEHPDAVHLDAVPSDFNAGLENSISSLHEVIGGQEDPFIQKEKSFEMLATIKADLLEEFSEREIDQIINASGYLPNTLYRKLLKWRKTHKREDYYETI